MLKRCCEFNTLSRVFTRWMMYWICVLNEFFYLILKYACKKCFEFFMHVINTIINNNNFFFIHENNIIQWENICRIYGILLRKTLKKDTQYITAVKLITRFYSQQFFSKQKRKKKTHSDDDSRFTHRFRKSAKFEAITPKFKVIIRGHISLIGAIIPTLSCKLSSFLQREEPLAITDFFRRTIFFQNNHPQWHSWFCASFPSRALFSDSWLNKIWFSDIRLDRR